MLVSRNALGCMHSNLLARVTPLRPTRSWYRAPNRSFICTTRSYGTERFSNPKGARHLSPSIASTWLTETPHLVVSALHRISRNNHSTTFRIQMTSSRLSLRCHPRTMPQIQFLFSSLLLVLLIGSMTPILSWGKFLADWAPVFQSRALSTPLQQ